MTRFRIGSITYWSLAVVLTVFGFLDLVAAGAPFFLTGIVMLVFGPWRHERPVLWPALIGVWSFVLGYLLVAPLGCRSTGGPVSVGETAIERVSCTNILGIDYSGGAAYRAPLLPGLVAGIAVAMIAAVVARRFLRKTRRTAPARS